MKLRFRAFDALGKASDGFVEAADEAEARALLRRDGLFVASVSPAADQPGSAALPSRLASARGGRARPRSLRGRKRIRALATWARQLALLVSTGTPVVEAVSALELQCRDAPWAQVLARVRSRIEDGAALSQALEAEPAAFDPVVCSLVAAGESSGKLDVMLTRLADLLNNQLRVRDALVGALIYPAVLVGVSTGVLAVMVCYVLPRFSGLFKTLNVPLPPTTSALMGLSAFVRAYWWAVLLLLVGGVGAAAYALSTARGRRARDTFLVRAWRLGRIFRSIATARMAKLLGTLLESRVPLLESLELARRASVNCLYADLLTRIKDAVTRGEAMSAELSASPLIEPALAQAVRNGEKTGRVPEVLSAMAAFLDEENQSLVKSLTTILEPAILLALGVIVGFVATSMFLPLFDLASMTGSGGA